MQPQLAANDLGSAPWERALIRAARERGFLWRTEQAYREWAVRVRAIHYAAFALCGWGGGGGSIFK
jgi:hypothetical protein